MVELPYNIAMIVGLPRSGTTLLQIALTEQPGIVTSHETHLFDIYIGPAFNRYHAEQRDLKSADGIRHHINADALMANFRTLAISILSSIHSKNPAARIVLEKTPGHLFYMTLIKQMLPTTRFIQLFATLAA